ncbi:hypothetical protein [Burkholderia ubonensis]|uniref:hypothetical protein n=1 Tax=Burkholderia ubonensis TaxID=101571 RepID=UPI001E4A3E4B|nr:hypothetical protein [Burkholderia ubonensis]
MLKFDRTNLASESSPDDDLIRRQRCRRGCARNVHRQVANGSNCCCRLRLHRHLQVRQQRHRRAVIDRILPGQVDDELREHSRHDRALAPDLVELRRLGGTANETGQKSGERFVVGLRHHVRAGSRRKRLEIVVCHLCSEHKKGPSRICVKAVPKRKGSSRISVKNLKKAARRRLKA